MASLARISDAQSAAGIRRVLSEHRKESHRKEQLMNPILTIGMATYDDYDGVYFTTQAIRLYHPEVTADTEILVIDNHPDGPCAAELKALENWIEGYRYVPWNRT